MDLSYGQLVNAARRQHNPPLSAKELANAICVSPPFITDIEKGRRQPSPEKQAEIKNILACEKYKQTDFDDAAASSNPDSRIVAEDIATALRTCPELRELIRTIIANNPTTEEIKEITANIGGQRHDIK